LSGTYHGFPAFLEGVLSKLNDASQAQRHNAGNGP